MPTRRARSRSDNDARPPSRAMSHAASRISAFVASRRSWLRSLVTSLVVSPNTVRNYERRSEHCQAAADEFRFDGWSKDPTPHLTAETTDAQARQVPPRSSVLDRPDVGRHGQERRLL